MMETDDKTVTVESVDVDETFIVKTDAGELCRLCANTDNQLIPIFRGEGLEHNLPVKIKTHLPIIKVTEVDKLPLQICYQCASTLISWNNLYEGCRVADKRLREILSIDDKYQEDETYADYVDDYRDDYDEETHESPSAPPPNTSNLASNTLKDVNSTEVSTLSDTKTLETESDRNNERSGAALDGEKWDPLIVPPLQTSSPSTSAAGATATYAEDRAKLVKSKKLGPLMRNYKGDDIAVLECDQCTAFFIDENDFEKHRKSHEHRLVLLTGSCSSGVDADYVTTEHSDVDGQAEVDARPEQNASSPKRRGRKKLSPNSATTVPSTRGLRNSSRQKLRIKVGGNVVVKKTAKKLFAGKSTSTSKSISTDTDDSKAVAASSSQKRRSTKSVSYTELDENDAKKANKKPAKHSFINDEDEIHVTRSRDAKKRKYSEIAEGNDSGTSVEMKITKNENVDIEMIEETVLSEQDGKKVVREQRSTSDGETSRKKPRLKRLRREKDEEEGRGKITYTCAHCLRNFRRKSNLKRHMSKLHFGKEKDEAGDSSKWFTGYCCDVCGEGLQVRSMMMAHRDVVHGKFPEIDWCKYQTSLARVKFCNECKKYFRGGKLFDEHSCDKGKSIVDEERVRLLQEAEDIPPSFVCYICNQCFRWKWDYRAHRETEHKDAAPIEWSTLKPLPLEFYCGKCFKAYSDAVMLREHQCSAAPQQSTNNTVVKPFRCELCGNDYFWKSDFRRHMRTKHPKENYRPTEHDTIIYSCPYCDEKFSMKKRILHHMRKAHSINSDSPFVCVKCNKVFRRRDNLDRHNESYHPTLSDQDEVTKILSGAEIKINGETAYHCEVCNRNISNPNRFISHYRGHYSENKFTCDLCGKQAKTQHQLNTHIKNIHLNIRNYKCDLCNKSFYTKQACEEHRRIHTGERPFSCEICGKTFVAGNALISHKRFHNDFFPHSCHLCPKKFKVRRSLINHIRTHTGERPFKCDLCTKTFNNSSQYSYHKKVTHSENRPFTCSLCGNCFKANKFLTRHMELHTVRSQIQSRKPNNPALYTTSQMKTSTVTVQPVVSTTMVVSHQQQPSALQQQPSVLQQQPPAGVDTVEQSVSAAPIMTSQVQSVHNVIPTTVYIKQGSPSTSSATSTYRNDDVVGATMYNLQRAGYESTSNEFVRPAAVPECEIDTMGQTAKRNFTAADAYMAAANYALGNEEYKSNSNTVTRPYNPPTQSQGNHPIAAGKHMTWL